MKKKINLLTKLFSILFLSIFFVESAFAIEYPKFDRGPDLSDPMQVELVYIVQDLPYLPGISQMLQVLTPSYKRGQKMRPDFGAMPLRGFLLPDSIKVLVIGQDGTHIAEGANRPSIAGFGGRVHDMLKHLGIYEGVFFTNLYVNTISGQYGSRNTPVYVSDTNEIIYTNVIENRQWLMTHEGAYGKWRNQFLSWVILNNLGSLKMVMMLGQAGKDAGANLVNYLGGRVEQRKYLWANFKKCRSDNPRCNSYKFGDGSQFKVPQFKMVSAGGNNEWAVPVTKDGDDVAELLRQNSEARQRVLDSEELKAIDSPQEKKKLIAALSCKLDYKKAESQLISRLLLKRNVEMARELMVFTKGGPEQNGVLYPQQFGGWDLNTMTVKGEKTRSIRGLNIPCNGIEAGACSGGVSKVEAPDIVFVGSPHPTALSKSPSTAASKVENELLKPLRYEMKRGWTAPQPEEGLDSPFLKGDSYKYGRGVIPPSHGDPGITDFRLLPVSTAQRAGKSMIVIGTRDRIDFPRDIVKEMEKDTPSNKMLLKSHGVLTGRPQFDEWLDRYDRGPDDTYSELLFESMNKQDILWVKEDFNSEAKKVQKKILTSLKKKDMSEAEREEIAYSKTVCKMYEKFGIDAFNFKTHPDAGFFGHYRGTFDSPEVVILADPDGLDSFITSKAATGNRGQYLNGLMQDLKVGAKYLVIKTVPVGMDGAMPEEWNDMLKATKKYRDELFKEILKGDPVLFADGKYAAGELERITGSRSKFIAIDKTSNFSGDMKKAGKAFNKKYSKKFRIKGNRVDIPREHLTWIARVWEGTSGDRVITTDYKKKKRDGSFTYYKGKAFAIVAPDWARKNTVYFSDFTREELLDLYGKLAAAGEPMPGENLSAFVSRREKCASATEWRMGYRDVGHRCSEIAEDGVYLFEKMMKKSGSR